MGLDVTASTAPAHVFVKYRDDAGQLHNLEATSGAGFTRDIWMRKQHPMSDQALSKGLYMQYLSKKETVTVIAETLNVFYAQQKQDQPRIALSEELVKSNPKDVSSMLQLSSAYWQLRQKHFVSKYPRPRDIPLEQQAYFRELDRNIGYWQDQAVALGWQPEKEEDEAAYLQTVRNAKKAP